MIMVLVLYFFKLRQIKTMIKIVQESQTQVKLHAQKQPWEVFYKKSVLKNFAKFTEKHLCQGLSFNKVAS